MNSSRIVITGLGAVSSIGIGKDAFWRGLVDGKSGISKISFFDTSAFTRHYAGEIKDFVPSRFVAEKKLSAYGRTSLLAVAAARMALDDAGISLAVLKGQAAGVCMGTTMGESQVLEKLHDDFVRRGPDAIDNSLIPLYPSNVLASNIASEFSLTGPCYVIPTACAAGNYAIGYAYDMIRAGQCAIMLAGGSDAFSRIAFIGFHRLLVIAPERCQPFDKNRKGMMVGEGAGILVLESMESAIKRKACIYAEVLGYGLSCDAHHMSAPYAPGIARAIENALQNAGIGYGDVDYVNAHGTGTPANDREECVAIKEVFKERYNKIPVSSIKSMLGHTMGAASSLEAIACCLAIQHDLLPPTINYETSDPDCDIDCVPNRSRAGRVDVALNNASAFGGNNACLVLKKFPQ
jgi:3-oxoacyl-[acyl-carrier-protein] synthase II